MQESASHLTNVHRCKSMCVRHYRFFSGQEEMYRFRSTNDLCDHKSLSSLAIYIDLHLYIYACLYSAKKERNGEQPLN